MAHGRTLGLDPAGTIAGSRQFANKEGYRRSARCVTLEPALVVRYSMIRKSAQRFSEKIMRNQEPKARW
jgi:hypothetical protein